MIALFHAAVVLSNVHHNVRKISGNLNLILPLDQQYIVCNGIT